MPINKTQMNTKLYINACIVLIRYTFQNVLRFWLDRGVDGFRIDAIPYLFEVKNLSQNVKPGDVSCVNKLHVFINAR